jgi:hypothetical protein
MFYPQIERFPEDPNYNQTLAIPNNIEGSEYESSEKQSVTLIAKTSSNGVCLGNRGSIL